MDDSCKLKRCNHWKRQAVAILGHLVEAQLAGDAMADMDLDGGEIPIDLEHTTQAIYQEQARIARALAEESNAADDLEYFEGMAKTVKRHRECAAEVNSAVAARGKKKSGR